MAPLLFNPIDTIIKANITWKIAITPKSEGDRYRVKIGKRKKGIALTIILAEVYIEIFLIRLYLNIINCSEFPLIFSYMLKMPTKILGSNNHMLKLIYLLHKFHLNKGHNMQILKDLSIHYDYI